MDEWFPGEDRSNPLSNAVTISAKELQKAWGVQTDYSRKRPSAYARRSMRKVQDAMDKLRACYTEASVEKASLQVACALLDLASVHHTCENPFLVLQQATIFASHGTKRGTSDDLFREALPDIKKCTPHEALVILGRADCFQAVYFPYEAAFLCAYVARAVNLHRETKSIHGQNIEKKEAIKASESGKGEKEKTGEKKGEKAEPSWSNRWMVVGILCYNVSIMIRGTAVGKVGGIKLREDYDPWDEDVIDELLLSRADAVAWNFMLSRKGVFSCEDCSKKAPLDDARPVRERDRRRKSQPPVVEVPMVVDAAEPKTTEHPSLQKGDGNADDSQAKPSTTDEVWV